MTTITATDIQNNFGKYLQAVQDGNKIVTIENRWFKSAIFHISTIIRVGFIFRSFRNRAGKKIAHYQSINDEAHKKNIELKKHVYQTKRINELYAKKNRVISNILHCSTKTIVDYCLANNITKVVIGDIKGIDNHKSDKKGKKEKEFNLKLHFLPFDKIYHMLDYKLRKRGITLIKQNEAFTSQCSPTSKEVSSKYADKDNRIYRGLYQDGNAIYNADSVGAFNILRKYYQENNIQRRLTCKCLSNPKKVSIPVTSILERKK